jgi:hypothetical protein
MRWPDPGAGPRAVTLRPALAGRVQGARKREIIEVPLIVRWEIFLVGVCTGLVLAAVVVIVSFLSAH